MASDSAWELGSQIASKNIAARRERKQKLSDEERTKTVSDLYTKGDSLAKLIPSMNEKDKQAAMGQLTDIEQSIATIYHPDNNPGALQKDWHMLRGLIHKSRGQKFPSASIAPTATPVTITPDAQTVTLPETPGYQSATGPSPWESPYSFGAEPLPRPSQVVRTSEPGTASQPITLPSTPITIPGTAAPRVRSLASMTPQERQSYHRREQARTRAEQDVAAAGLTPEQTAQADAAQKLAYVRQAVKDYATINPDADSKQKAAFLADVVEKTYGIASKPVWKEYVGPNGKKEWMDASKPEAIPPGWNATGTESADTRTRADFDAYKKAHPEYTGTLQQWKVEQGQLGKLAVPTSRDDRFIAIEQKKALLKPGETLSKDDQAFADAYDLYIKKRVTGPMLARVAAQAADRYIPVIDPTDPTGERVTMMQAGTAAAAHVGTPASIGFQTEKAMNKYMTSGKGGENIAFFSTAVSHLGLLNEIGMALDNGDLQTVNRLGNIIATETGGEAPTDFNAVKNAVAGEIAKVFTGRGATVEEITQINATINAAQTPAQIKGAINYYLLTMGGKLGAVKAQAESAQPGGVARTLDAAQAAAQKTASDVTGGGGASAGGGAAGGVWTAPPNAPDASTFPEGHELYNKRTKQVEAVVRGGKWSKP